ncbi:MAG: globin [Campylobacterales bacterium]|nr:globin [Campylobacterales bacterium]
MGYEVTKVKKGEQVHFKMPDPAFYEALGYEGMKDLMYRFYDEIYESAIANFFPQDEEEFNKVKEKNALFFIQLCGGPKVYENEAKGMNLNEYMIRLHDEFSIYEKSRYEWLGCMETVLRETDIPQKLKDDFWSYLENFSKLTVNTFSDGSVYYAAYTQALEDK